MEAWSPPSLIELDSLPPCGVSHWSAGGQAQWYVDCKPRAIRPGRKPHKEAWRHTPSGWAGFCSLPCAASRWSAGSPTWRRRARPSNGTQLQANMPLGWEHYNGKLHMEAVRLQLETGLSGHMRMSETVG